MVHQEQGDQAEARIGIEARIEANGIEGHNVETKDALRRVTNAPEGIGVPGAEAALKRVASAIDRTLRLRHHEIPMHHDPT